MTNLLRLMPACLFAGVILLLLTGCSDNDGASGLLQSRVEASFDVTAKVTYEMAFDLEGTGNPNPVSVAITQGPWGRRSDGSLTTEARTFSSTLLDLGDEKYICGRDLGEDGGCLRAEDAYQDPDELFAYAFGFAFSFRETLTESDELEWKLTSARTIAGIDADCYEVTSTDPEADTDEVEICFSGDDILLSAEVRSSKATITVLALEVDHDVEEDDFALPYPIVERP